MRWKFGVHQSAPVEVTNPLFCDPYGKAIAQNQRILSNSLLNQPNSLVKTGPSTDPLVHDWSGATSKLVSGMNNANVTVKLDDNGKSYYVKAVPSGGERAEVADKLMGTLGLPNPNTRVVDRDSAEGKQLLQKFSGFDLGDPHDPDSMKCKLDRAKEFLVMDPVPGEELNSLDPAKASQAIKDPNFQQQLGKMMAADNMVAGNSDRTSVIEYKGVTHVNLGNFKVFEDSDHHWNISTLDNEFVSPSRQDTTPTKSLDDHWDLGHQMVGEFTGGGGINYTSAEMYGLGQQPLPFLRRIDEDATGTAEKILKSMNAQCQGDLSDSEIKSAAENVARSYHESRQTLLQHRPEILDAVSQAHDSGSGLMNPLVLEAKLDYNQFQTRSLYQVNSDRDCPIHIDTTPTPAQAIEHTSINFSKQLAAQGFVGSLEPVMDKFTLQVLQYDSKSEQLAAIKGETGKVRNCLDGFNNQGMAHEQKAALKASGYVQELRSNYNDLARTLPKDKAITQALNEYQRQLTILENLSGIRAR